MKQDSGSRSRRRVLTVVVFAVLVGSAVGTASLVNRVVHDQERRLLNDRASEAGALLSTSFSPLTSTLPILGAVSVADPQLFGAMTQGFAQGGRGAIGTATKTGDTFVVNVAAGDGPAVGDPLTGERALLATRALVSTGFASTVFEHNGQRRLAFALPVGAAHDAVIYEEFGFDQTAITRTADSPFSELDGVVYASSTADPARLLFETNPGFQMTGDFAARSFKMGTDDWLLVVKARSPLVGDFAKNSPWYVLAVGLLTALLVTALVEIVSRRRVYALALVDDRTAELRDALAEKDQLEQGQRLAREAAEEANRSKSEFLSRMSHELRTPLNAVLGFAQLLEIEELAPADHDSVKQILKGGRHLLDLINEVLDITRIETGTFQLSPEPVLAGEVLDDIVELTKPLAAQANIHLLTGATSGRCDVHVLADRQRLKQILLNLVSNAIKYNRPGGTVALSCERSESSVLRIRVHDTGPGIRPEHVGLLFTPFERLGAEHTSVEGSGIGLALSRRLAEAMGGTIDVETTLGQGTTFWVELPVVEGPVERYVRLNGHEDLEKPAAMQRTRKILYIEDNVSNLRLVERILARDGDIELVSAMQGRLGVELAREHRPALILLDLHLPDIAGDEVLRQLRDDPETSSIPVVVVSADATAGQITRLLAEGARAYLTKPLDVSELRDLVDGLPAGKP